MTITTSKQLAEALPASNGWETPRYVPDALVRERGDVLVESWPEGWAASRGMFQPVFAADPRGAVLGLADKLEAEAKALRESLK